MKKIEAVVRSEKVGAIREGLEKVGYSGLMITQVNGHGQQRGTVQEWRGEKYKVELVPKSRIEIVARDEDVARIVDLVVSVARTGEIGDGKIFISPIEEVIRIRTGERGKAAL